MTIGRFIAFFIIAHEGILNNFHSVINANASASITASYISLQYVTQSPMRRLHSCIATGSYTLTFAPASINFSIITNAGASLISSVSGLNANPHKATVLPCKSPLNCFINFSNKTLFWFSFTSSTAVSTRMV